MQERKLHRIVFAGTEDRGHAHVIKMTMSVEPATNLDGALRLFKEAVTQWHAEQLERYQEDGPCDISDLVGRGAFRSPLLWNLLLHKGIHVLELTTLTADLILAYDMPLIAKPAERVHEEEAVA